MTRSSLRLFGTLFTVIVCALAGESGRAAPTFAAAVDALAQPVLLGMQLSTRRAAQRKVVSEPVNKCVQAIQPSAFYDVVDRLVSASFSKDELAAIDKFFRTPVGRKYLKHGMLQLYAIAGEPPPEPSSAFSDAEYREVESFAATGPGQMLMAGRVMQSQAAKQAYDARIHELLEGCKAKPAKVGSWPPGHRA